MFEVLPVAKSVLDGRQLLEQSLLPGAAPLPATGLKRSGLPKDQEDEETAVRVSAALDPLSRPGVVRADLVSQAEWDPELGLAVASRTTGRHWEAVGHSVDNLGTCLWPEEALFLLESRRLRLLIAGVPASVQDAYHRLLGPGCSLEKYRVYSHLSKLGYKLVRTIVTPKNDPTVEEVKECVTLSSDDEDEDDLEDGVPAGLAEGPLTALWSGQTKPLLQPKHAISTTHVLDRIKLGRPAKRRKRSQNCDEVPLAFDAYIPSAPFKKTRPRTPNYRIAVIPSTSEESIPSQEALRRVSKSFSDDVPVLLACCKSDSISFYCLSSVSLPTDITIVG